MDEEQRFYASRLPVFKAGGCNFCTRDISYVWELGGFNRALRCRICDTCLRQLKEQTKRETP